MRKINIPVFVSHQGCPNDCIFCNQKKITGVYKKEKYQEIKEKISSYLATADETSEIEISFFGGSFTGIEKEEQDMYLSVAKEFFYDRRVKGIRVSTRPDYITKDILDNLYNSGVTTIELGVQSMDDNVLTLNKRGLKSDATKNAVKLIREYNFSLGLQMMVGMYGSDEERDLYTAEEIIKLMPDFVRIYPTVVIKETELYKLYKEKKYIPYTLDKAVEVCSKILKKFNDAKIDVIRIGLMSGEDINEKNVYGPYHSSFRELVESYIYYKKLRCDIKNIKAKDIVIYCNKKNTSKIIGNKKSNINKLIEEFNLNSLKVKNEEIKDYIVKEDI